MFDFAPGQGGAGGARPAAHPARARTWSARCRSSTRCTAGWERPYVGAGLALYDAHGDGRQVRHGRAQAQAPLPQAARPGRARPAHRRAAPAPSATTTARSTTPGSSMTLARTAAHHGAHVATRTRVTGFLRDGEPGRRRHAPATSRTDVDLEVRARVVINAAGVWTDEVQELLGGDAARSTSRPARASTSSCPRDRIRSECGFITKTEKSVLFVIPWGASLDHRHHRHRRGTSTSRTRRPAARDIDYLLGHVNALLRDPLDHDDVDGVYAGLRPLLKPVSAQGRAGRDHQALPRAHRRHPVPGLVLIAGGKLTTYRVMARDAVDHAHPRLSPARAAEHHRAGAAARGRGASRPAPTSASPSPRGRASRSRMVDHLLGRYGGLVDELLDLVGRAARAGRAAAGRRRLPRRRGRLRRHATRAPATSTTS